MEEKLEESDRYIGVFFGLLLWIIWIAPMFFIERIFYPKQVFLDNPVIYWLYVGLIMFFIMAGEHLLYNRKLGDLETIRSLIFLKSNIIGFIIWIILIGLLSLHADVPNPVYAIGGYLTILIIYLLWNRIVSLKYEHIERGKDTRI